MTTNDIDAIRKLANAATEGPWEAEGEIVQVTGEVRYICDVFGLADKWPTAEFIAAARTLVPALCDEVEQLREHLRPRLTNACREVARLTVELEKVRGQYADTRHHNDLLTAELADQQRANNARANENAKLKQQIAKAREIANALDKTDEANAHAGGINAQYHGYGARILYATAETRCDCCYAYGTTQQCGAVATTEMTVHPFGILAVNDACKARINGTAEQPEVAR